MSGRNDYLCHQSFGDQLTVVPHNEGVSHESHDNEDDRPDLPTLSIRSPTTVTWPSAVAECFA